MMQVLADTLHAVTSADPNVNGKIIAGSAVTVSTVIAIVKAMAGRVLAQFDALSAKVQTIAEDVSFIKGKIE